MRGIYLYTNIDVNKQTSGEAKKAEMQVRAFEKLGVSMRMVDVNRTVKFNKIYTRLPFSKIYNSEVLIDLINNDLSNVNFIYIRKYIIDKSFIKLLKNIKLVNDKIKIIFEIPTYPYDAEWSRIIDKPLLFKENIYRKKLSNYVDRIVTFSEDNYIFKIPTIKINNGIDINDIRKKTIGFKSESINLLGVALLAKWHGYDRLIQGLNNYYTLGNDTKIINFYIVGEGSELRHLQREVGKYNLSEYVHFLGKMHGTELDEIYNKADIAVGSLGMYRIGLKKGYTLKLREYCARGIPFIKGYEDVIFDAKKFKYMLNFSNDSTPIDIQEIVLFYSEIKNSNNEIIEYMNDFAKENLTWEQQMKPIFDFIYC